MKVFLKPLTLRQCVLIVAVAIAQLVALGCAYSLGLHPWAERGLMGVCLVVWGIVLGRVLGTVPATKGS